MNKIRKRDGQIVDFDVSKIERVIIKAFDSVNADKKDINLLIKDIIEYLEEVYTNKIPDVEGVQDIIEEKLMKTQPAVAKAFILYREYRNKLRAMQKVYTGSIEKTNLTQNAIQILEARYLLKNDNGEVIETPEQLFKRVADTVAKTELKYNKDKDFVKQLSNKFYNVMKNLDFLPNSPTLMNAGTSIGQLSACFVLPIGDSIDEIFESVKNTAKIHQSGGGTGFSFSRLRPKGARVKSTKGIASGSVSFIKVFDVATDVIKQGGKRRGANMGILRVDHPDIFDFITAKQKEGTISNFNFSVGLTDEFIKALEVGGEYDLIDPHLKKVVRRIDAKSVFDLIANMAWSNGEPGLVFLDVINKDNQVANVGEIESTNPCGEQPLLPYESCNLGSINLANMVEDGKILWKKLEDTTRIAVRFLDNIIDINHFPLPQIEKMTKSTRKIGLGVMGWADMLLQLKISYDSDDAVYLAEKVMKFINDIGVDTSVKLADERGSFPAFKGSKWDEMGYNKMRNATITTIAPTGTISMIADTSSGIEPLFSIAYTKFALDNKEFVYVNKYFEAEAKKRGFYDNELMYRIAKEGSIQHIENVPDDIKKLFVTTHEIGTMWHVKMQAAFQKHVHNAVSKTINMPNSATIDDVKEAYLESYRLGCKGITVYRDGSRQFEILTKGVKDNENEKKEIQNEIKHTVQKLIAKKIPDDECPVCHSKMQRVEGCFTCQKCGYSKCS